VLEGLGRSRIGLVTAGSLLQNWATVAAHDGSRWEVDRELPYGLPILTSRSSWLRRWRDNVAAMEDRSLGGGGEKWEVGHRAGLFIGLGVRAHADHCPGSNLKMNQRFIKSLLQIGYEFDSQILSILLRLQGFIEGIRRHLGCVLLPDRVAVSGWQVRYWLGLAGPEWAGASELGCEGGPRGGGRKRKKEWSGRGRGPRGFGILKFFFPIFLIGFKNQNEFESE
jgi:hypothetical protein